MPEPVAETPALRLSDEEALALAVQADRSWPSPLPTVDLASSEEVLAAIMRGWRSLSIRDLVIDGAPSPALAVATRAVNGVVFARTFLSNSGVVPSSLGSFTTFIAASDRNAIIVNVATPAGVHVLGEVTVNVARGLLRDAVTEAFERDGEVHHAPSLRFCVVGAGTTVAALSVTRDEVTEWASGPDGMLQPGDVGHAFEAPLKRLLDVVLPRGA